MPRGHLMDLTGQRYGRLLVESLRHVEAGRAVWNCLCDCGNTAIVKAGYLRSNSTKSCGCHRRRNSAEMRYVHGHTRSPIYLTWVSMLQRCNNPEATGYQYYGGRGIKVCPEWYKFQNFRDDMAPRPVGKTLDRIDTNGHYTKANCRWATPTEQRASQRPRRSKEL